MASYEKKISYIEQVLNFYFDDLRESVRAGDIGTNSLDNFANMAALFEKSVPEANSLSLDKKDEIFCLIEDLFLEAKVGLGLGEKVESIDLEDIGSGYEFDRNQYSDIVQTAYDILLKNGIELYKEP